LSAARQYDQTIEEDILMEKKDSYTPAAAKRAYDQLDQLVADKALTARQAGAHRRHIARQVRLVLKPSYKAARRAKPRS